MAELSRRIWAAQLETLFPLIESERLEIIDAYRGQLMEQIALGLSQFGEEVLEPEDVELGTLVYLNSAGKLNIASSDTKSRLYLLRTCRNQLAHRCVCDAQEVVALLS